MRKRLSGAFGTGLGPITLIAIATLVVAACASAGSQTVLSTVGSSVGEGNAGPAPSAGPVDRDPVPGQDAAFRDDARIVRTGALQLEVGDVAAALRSARETVLAMGGYIGASQQYDDGEQVIATVTYRIPAERWEEALDRMRGLGDLVGEQTDAIEVTDQIVDLDARIRNLRASETALVNHAAAATKISDLLEVEARLSDVRGQIERLTAEKANLEDRASLATLTVTFGVEVQAITLAAERWDPKSEVEQATASLVGLLQALTTAGIWFAIVVLPVLLGILLVAGLVLVIRRRLRSPAGDVVGA